MRFQGRFLRILASAGVFAACGGGRGGADSGTDSLVADVAIPDLVDSPTVDPGTPTDVATDVTPDAGTLPFDLAACGGVAHSWLPVTEVGKVVLWEEHELSGLEPAQVDGLLAQVKYGALSPVPFGVRNFRLRYVTQDRGKLREATALVGIPVGVPAGQKVPVALWLHGTTGFMDQCAPSADPVEGPAATTLLASIGYWTVAPDYLGMLGFGEPSPAGTIHPYLVGEATAVASLDSVRAALAATKGIADLPQGDAARVVLWGGSQGGHAAFFVDRYAPYYAPELGIAAVASEIPPTDLIDTATYAMGHWGATATTFIAVVTAMRDWYGHPADLKGVLTDTEPHHLATNLPIWMAGGCTVEGEFKDVDTLEDVYTATVLDLGGKGEWDKLPPWDCFLAENSVGRTSVPRAADTPVLTVFGENDDLVITALERLDVPRLCKQGYRIQYLECAGKGHSEAAVAAIPYVHHWLQERLSGAPWPQADICTVTPAVDCEKLP